MGDFNWSVADSCLLARIESLFQENESANNFAKRCKIDPGNLAKFRKHKLTLGRTYIRRIANACQVSERWLETGSGDKGDVNQDNEIRTIKPTPTLLDDSHLITIELLRAENRTLSDSVSAIHGILSTMHEILEQNKECLAQNRALMQYIVDSMANKQK